jgi:N-acyl-D-aspartate/D-glutamate deacylase
VFDIVIKNGTLVDGTGSAPVLGDVAIADGRIIDVGSGIAGRARRTIDADGALVTPGWVDVHTHYDGQISWDSEMAPSSHNGVTTIVMGNCGVGFAPVRPGDENALIELMEGLGIVGIVPRLPRLHRRSRVRARRRRADRTRGGPLLRDGRTRPRQRGCHSR